MKKKNIGVIGLKGLPAFGGAAIVGQSIIEQLKVKYNFTVYAISSHTDLKSGTYNDYNLVVFNKFFISELNILYYYLASAFHSLFKNFHLIHLHHSTAAFIIFVLRLKYKVISTSHGLETDNKWKYLKTYIRIQAKILLGYSNIITTVSLLEFDKHNNKYKELYYIPNGINLPLDNNFDSPPQGEYILFCAGRIIPIKGCHIFLEAMLKLNFKGRILIIGDLDQLPEYKRQIINLAKCLNVEFISLIKNKALLHSYIVKSKLFIFPSLFENMSMMLLEAISLKANIICSDIPANTLIFSNDEILFFKNNDSNDLAEKFSFAIENMDILEEKSIKAYNRLETDYLWDNIAHKYSHLYEKLL